jgi:hypothetical protein
VEDLTGDYQHHARYNPNPGQAAARAQAQDAGYQESSPDYADRKLDKFPPGGSHEGFLSRL